MRVFSLCAVSLMAAALVLLSGCSKAAQPFQQVHTVAPYQITLASPTQPKAGENQFSVSVTPLHGALPANLKVSVQTVMPSMADMAVPKPVVMQKDKGHYAVQTDFIMAGEWDLTLSVSSDKTHPVSTHFRFKAIE